MIKTGRHERDATFFQCKGQKRQTRLPWQRFFSEMKSRHPTAFKKAKFVKIVRVELKLHAFKVGYPK